MARHWMPLSWMAAALLLAGPSSPPTHAADATAPRPPAARTLSPLMTELRTLLDEERTSLASLGRQLAGTHDQASALAIQREVARVKLSTEVALLRVQAKHARAAGHAAFADELEAAARELESPTAARAGSTPTTVSNR